MATITQALTDLTQTAPQEAIVFAVALTPLIYAFGYTIEKVGIAVQAIGSEIRAWLDRRRHDPAQEGQTTTGPPQPTDIPINQTRYPERPRGHRRLPRERHPSRP